MPTIETPVPKRVRELAAKASLRCVWENPIGGLTFHATGVGEDRYIKWGPPDLETTMREEAERITWATRWIRVPVVLDHGDDDTHE